MPNLSKHDREEELRAYVRQWVKEECKKRYSGKTSHGFLVEMMMRGLNKICYEKRHWDDRHNIAYSAVCWIFEGVLEHRLKCGGNGHHRAQSFNAWIEKFEFSSPQEKWDDLEAKKKKKAAKKEEKRLKKAAKKKIDDPAS